MNKKTKNPADKVEQWPIDKLVPYAKNSRTHSEEQIAQLAASIKEWGFTSAVLVDEEGGIIAGHGRVMAARKLGMESLPVMVAAGWTDAQKRAYVIADNKLALNAGWDNDLLALELGELGDLGFDVELTGFTADEIQALMPVDLNEGHTDPDDAPAPPENPITRLGDVWILGKHRVMCGDSTSIDAVEKLMDGRKADMVFTDPPYKVEYQSNKRTKSAKFDVLKNDDTFLDIAPIIEACSTGWVFVWTSWKVQTKWIDQFQSMGYPTNIVVWHKPGGGIGDLKKTFFSDYEIALVWHRGAELCGKRIGSVWTVNKDGASTYVHPTQKPVALAEEALNKTTRASAVIMDLFGGSGSTLIACEKTARDCRMMELDPKYCDVIIKRWQDFTGKKAINAETNQPFAEVTDGNDKAKN